MDSLYSKASIKITRNWHCELKRSQGLDIVGSEVSLPTSRYQDVAFWVVTPCSDVVGNQRFGGPCCLYLQGEVKI
jgi:hypothetical protein